MAEPAAGGVPDRVFLSYRREDTRHLAGRLYDRLAERFGHGHIFIDVDSIEPGADFLPRSRRPSPRAVCFSRSSVVPGSTPATSTVSALDDPDDFVVLEITAALRCGVRVLPVLVDGAAPPHRNQLPDALVPLANRNAVRVNHETFRSDVDTLLHAIAMILHVPGATSVTTSGLRGSATSSGGFARTVHENSTEGNDEPRARATPSAARVPVEAGVSPPFRLPSDRYELGATRSATAACPRCTGAWTSAWAGTWR